MSSTFASIFLLGTGYVVMTSMWFAFVAAKPVIIIGAGVAGAKVALDLHRKSIDFIIIEATEKVGGRLRQARFGPDRLAVEAGANWLHGYRAENSVSSFHDRFVKLSGLNTKFDDVVFIKNGKKVPDRDSNIVYDRFGKALNKVYALARTAKTKNGATTFDLSVRSALLFAAGWEADSPIEKAVEQSYIDYDNAVPGNVVSFHGITPISEPGSPETADYFIADPRGFSSLVTTMLRRAGIKDPLRSGPKLLLKSPVHTVEYGPMTATVTLRDGKRIAGSAIVSTVSLGVLQESLFRNPFEPTRLIFSPPLSRRKQLAISKYDFADYLKVFVQFDKPFFKASDPLFIIPLQCKEGQFINIQNLNKKGYLPGSNAVLLTATAAFSRQLTCMDNEGTLREALPFASLAVGRKIHRSEVKAIYYKNWRKDPFFKGSYSCRTVGMTKEDFQALEEPSGTLFFAGEAVNDDGLNGYVQGAWNSGARTAQKIAKGMSKL